MAESKETKKRVHQGQNVRFAREHWHDIPMTQAELGEKIGKSQKEISRF